MNGCYSYPFFDRRHFLSQIFPEGRSEKLESCNRRGMANPHWNIWVDWGSDGIWGEANEDVTPDLMHLHWEWGRELTRDRARPRASKVGAA